MSIKKITCQMTGKKWEEAIASSEEWNNGWLTIKMKNKDVLSFHKDSPTMKVEY